MFFLPNWAIQGVYVKHILKLKKYALLKKGLLK